MNLVAFRAFYRRNVRELPQIINYIPRIREYVERDEYKTQHRPGHLSPRSVVPGMHRKRTPEEMEELRQEAERERAERYQDAYRSLGLEATAHKDGTLEVSWAGGCRLLQPCRRLQQRTTLRFVACIGEMGQELVEVAAVPVQ